MPWRKRYDHTLSLEEKGQRAYEVSRAYQAIRSRTNEVDMGSVNLSRNACGITDASSLRGDAAADSGRYCELRNLERDVKLTW